MDYVTISVIFVIFLYLFITRPRYISAKETNSPKAFSTQNILDYTLPLRSDSEFDQEDIENIYHFIKMNIDSLALKKPYDLLIYLDIRVDRVVDFHIIAMGSIEKHLNDLRKVCANELFTKISHFPNYYNYHNVFRFYNNKTIYTYGDITRFYRKKTGKFMLELDSQNNRLTNQFRSMSFTNKLKYIQKYLHDNGFNRMILSLWDFDRLGKSEENIKWLSNEIGMTHEKEIIDIKHFTSKLNFWLIQLEYKKEIPFIPIFLGSFYINNGRFDIAQHYFKHAIPNIPRNFWLYQYCLNMLSFIDLIHEEEQNWINDSELLLEIDEADSAEELLKEYLKLNPYSAKINHTLYSLENQINSANWSLKQRQEFLTQYKQKIYIECDPFFINGLEILDQEENDSYRKNCLDPYKCDDPLFYFYKLGEYNIYLSFALTNFWGQESYDSEMIETISNFVDQSPEQILQLLKDYSILFWKTGIEGGKIDLGDNFEIC